MMASGFKPVGWVAAVGGAALGCYMLSLQVAAERADVTSLDSRIVAARQQIRSLQTELGTRGRLQQLEAWNDDVLALAAPASGQFLEGDVSLARFETHEPQVGAQAAEVRLASAEVPAAPAPAAPAHAAPTPTPTPTPTPAPQRAVAERSAVAPQPPVAQPVVRRASDAAKSLRPASTTERPRTTTTERTRTASTTTPQRTRATTAATPATPRARTTAATTTPARARPAAATPARSTALLGERATRDLRTAARAERNRGTAD
jgi:outer membrane biosynthesis protein TonB